MKRLICALVMIVLAVLCMPLEIFAQDTLDITPLPAGNINTVINGDTVTGGFPAHPNRVYRLTRGVVYQVTQPMTVNGSITMIATSGTTRPPVLQPAILPDNSSPTTFFNMIGKKGKIDLSDMYMIGTRSDNVWVGGMVAINCTADSILMKCRRVIFDSFQSGHLGTWWGKYDIQDCVFRNHQATGGWYSGQPIVNTVVTDTMLIINNTFFADDSYCGTVGYTTFALFEHNTYVYGIVNPYLIRGGTNMHFKNNLYYAMNAMGGNPGDVIQSGLYNYPDTASSGVFHIRAHDTTSYWAYLWWDAVNNKPGEILGPNRWIYPDHGTTAAMLDEHYRVVEVRKNNWFLPVKLGNFYKAYNDTVKSYDSVSVPVYQAAPQTMWLKRIMYWPTFYTKYTQWWYDSGAAKLSSHIYLEQPIIADPGFNTAITNHLDSVINYVNEIASQTIGTQRWCFPSNQEIPVAWPLPENLAYTNTSLQTAGTDGFALGDLNWFPAQKAQWVTTGIRAVDRQPQEYSLAQNYPNPFNPTTVIEFSLPRQSKVNLTVYNLLGQEVTTLVASTLGAGRYSIQFDASKLASGVYVYRLAADNFVKASKMMLIK